MAKAKNTGHQLENLEAELASCRRQLRRWLPQRGLDKHSDKVLRKLVDGERELVNRIDQIKKGGTN